MKFSHQIQFNAVPDWARYYLPYSNLKKLIYIIEKDKIASARHTRFSNDLERGPDERTALMDELDADEMGDTRFIVALDGSLDTIKAFYTEKETMLYKELKALLDTLENENRTPSENSFRDTDTTGTSPSPANVISQNMVENDPEQCFNLGKDSDELRKKIVELFVQLSELKSFVALNLTAFSKILKKYDKITNSSLKSKYIANHVGEAYPFKKKTKTALNHSIQKIERQYALLTTSDNIDQATAELKVHLRDHIVWERNTVWREMVGQERRMQSVMLDEAKPSTVRTPFGTVQLGRDQALHGLFLVASVVVFIILLFTDVFPQVEQNRCFAILVFASLLWAGEVMPLFVTALLVPFLIVILRVMRSDDDLHTRLGAPAATKKVFASMFSPVIMLLLGGFAIAGALSKFGIAKSMATFVLSRAGTRPSRVLLVNMLVATVASMWISNVAAPVLCFTIIQPILRTLPVDSRFGPCLIIGIALASNLGGLASPISSPQNIIAIQNMSPAPSWAEWFLASIPLCLLGNVIIWLWLLWSYKPDRQTTQIHTIRASHDPITPTQVYVCLVTLLTIVLWCLAHTYENTFGDMGVIAIIPLIAFFGTGLLTKDDFNNFLWNVIVLAMGGIALGKAVESSGLLHTIAGEIEQMVTGLSAFEVLFVFSCLVLVIATFISHTVAALIVLPIVAEVGARLEDPQPRLLVMGTAFMCSAAMGLPVSGFPNMNAISQEDELGKPYLTTKDFLRNGVPSSVFTMLCITTVGYGLMRLIGI